MSAPETPTFRLTRFRESYDIAEVDAFLVEIRPWLDARLPNLEVAARIRDVAFTPVRMRPGYDLDQVDDHLDELQKLASQEVPRI